MKPMPSPEVETPEEAGSLILERFAPYRLSVLSNTVSRVIARIYAERFDLTIPEWRVMAQLGRHGRLSASDIVGLTAMDKVRVSRAAQDLVHLADSALRRAKQAGRDRVMVAEPGAVESPSA